MEKRKAQMIHRFAEGETIINNVLMGENDDVLIILTNKGVYKVDLTARVLDGHVTIEATVSAIRP